MRVRIFILCLWEGIHFLLPNIFMRKGVQASWQTLANTYFGELALMFRKISCIRISTTF